MCRLYISCLLICTPSTAAPYSPHNCTIGNVTTVSLEVRCREGFDGGLEQSFWLEVINSTTGSVVLNVSAPEPYFKLSKLAPGNSVQVKVYAANVKGRSQPFELEGSTLKAEKHTGNVPQNWRIPTLFFFCVTNLVLFFFSVCVSTFFFLLLLAHFLSPISTPISLFGWMYVFQFSLLTRCTCTSYSYRIVFFLFHLALSLIGFILLWLLAGVFFYCDGLSRQAAEIRVKNVVKIFPRRWERVEGEGVERKKCSKGCRVEDEINWPAKVGCGWTFTVCRTFAREFVEITSALIVFSCNRRRLFGATMVELERIDCGKKKWAE